MFFVFWFKAGDTPESGDAPYIPWLIAGANSLVLYAGLNQGSDVYHRYWGRGVWKVAK